MKVWLPGLLACLISLEAQAQREPAFHLPTTGRTLADFIPAGYDTLSRGYATGDLNRDGRQDVVLALGWSGEDTVMAADESAPLRRLVILFGSAAGYTLAAQATRVVLCRGCGGQYGDPFEGLAITPAGVLTVYHYGGSSWRWSLTHKFRFQQNDFFLIGETKALGRNTGECTRLPYPPGWDYRDTNLLTGEYKIERVSEDCRLLVNKRGRSKPAPLRQLTAFIVGP